MEEPTSYKNVGIFIRTQNKTLSQSNKSLSRQKTKNKISNQSALVSWDPWNGSQGI